MRLGSISSGAALLRGAAALLRGAAAPTLPKIGRQFSGRTAQDVLLFRDDRKAFYNLVSFAGTLIGAASIFQGLTFYKGARRKGGSREMAARFDAAKSKVTPDESTWWRRYQARLFRAASGDVIRVVVCGFVCVFGVACFLVGVVVPVKCVQRLSLMKDNVVSITTFGPMGFSRSYKFLIDDVTSSVARKSDYSSIPLQARGHSLGFSLDNKRGKFFNVEIFDKVVSVNRSFKKKKM